MKRPNEPLPPSSSPRPQPNASPDTPEERLMARWAPVVDRYFDQGLDSLSPWERQFFLTFHLLSELEEGGLDQFFSNAGGHLAPDAASALQSLGFDSEAGHLQKAIRQFPEQPPPADQQDRNRIIDTLPDESLAVWEAVTEILLDSADDILERLDATAPPANSSRQ